MEKTFIDGSISLYLVRHGQSMWQTNHSQSSDSALSEVGYQQLPYLKSEIENIIQHNKNTVIYTSPLKRAQQTLAELTSEFTLESSLKEALFHVSPCLPSFDTPNIYKSCKSENQSYRIFKLGLKSMLIDILHKHLNHHVILYTHGGVIKTMLRIIHDNDAICYTIHNSSITHIVWKGGRWHIHRINDTRFLPDDLIT